jgi:hydroxymethylpyrimidine pyrophosphatase-like HAD family hydrolase
MTTYEALALDYDGTLATDGAVPPHVVDELARYKAGGGRLFLVTGRERADLEQVFSAFELFERLVLENGALLFEPRTHAEVELAKPPAPALVLALQNHGVSPLSQGKVIVATFRHHAAAVMEVIATMDLELQVIFNKDALMILPTGVDKASGLEAALTQTHMSPKKVVGIGDGENDHSLLAACGLGVAVANAVESLKHEAAFVTRAARGDGVLEAMDRIFASGMHLAAHRA